MEMTIIVVVLVVLALSGLLGFGICDEWDRRTLFTLGRFTKIVGPGLYFYIPLLQSIKHKIDMRIVTYIVPLQKGLTKDNIPVEVDAIVFYRVNTVKLAVLSVDDYHAATQLSVRSSIRDMVGKSSLDELLSERDKIGDIILQHVAEFVSQWGVLIIGIEIKDVIVSKELEDAISREAAAEREKRARLKLAEAEELSVDFIINAADKYRNNPTALQLRSMNMLYEMCMEGKATTIFIPISDSGNGMPSIIGVEGIKSLIDRDKDQRSPEEFEELFSES